MLSFPTPKSITQWCGMISLLCSAWNLFGDLYFLDFFYAYASDEAFAMVRQEARSGNLFDLSNAWLGFLAQAGGWMYPMWALVTVLPLYPALQSAGHWISLGPCALLVYGLVVMGGTLHSAVAFLTVLPGYYHNSIAATDDGAAAVDIDFVNGAQAGIIQHLFFGFLPGYLACNVAGIWLAFVVHRGNTKFTRWFNLFNPFATMVWVSLLSAILPGNVGYYIGGSMGTWGVMMLSIGISYYLWHDHGPEDLLAALSSAEAAVGTQQGYRRMS